VDPEGERADTPRKLLALLPMFRTAPDGASAGVVESIGEL